MKEHPIIFSGEMVRAILEGRKTQTRRVIKPTKRNADGIIMQEFADGWWPYNMFGDSELDEDGTEWEIPCPYGKPGDRLWVRETWNIEYGAMLEAQENNWHIVYQSDLGYLPAPTSVADEEYARLYDSSVADWRPSIHMPRWAARLFLRVTDIRVERVQDITWDDCIAEGVDPKTAPDGENVIDGFHDLWDSINAKRGFGWDLNPWVWVITFEREMGI